MGDSPETVWEEGERAYHLYLGRDGTWFQHVYSGAHEAFHRVCSPCDSRGHWVDEMLAVMYSVHYLKLVDMTDHAKLTEEDLTQKSTRCSAEVALTHQGRYPDGFYGRCFVIGRELLDAVGWDGLVELNETRTPDETPDPKAWLAGLPTKCADHVRSAIGTAVDLSPDVEAD